MTAGLSEQLPEYGRNVAIGASDMPAYANGQRFVSTNGPERGQYSDLLMGPSLSRFAREGGGLTAIASAPRFAPLPIFPRRMDRRHGP